MVNANLIGKVIQSFRKSKGLSQEVLSGLAGLDRTHYSKIERGLRSPTIETLFKISHALGITPHELMIGIEQKVKEEENQKETAEKTSLPFQ